MTAVMKLGSSSLVAKLSRMSVTTCLDMNLPNKALKAVMKLGSSSLVAKLLRMSVTLART